MNLTKGHASGLTPHAIIEQVVQMQMIDVHLTYRPTPTQDPHPYIPVRVID